MKKTLHLHIDRAVTPVAVGAAFVTTFGTVAVAAGLLAATGFGGRIDSALRNRYSGLGLYVRRGLGHKILCGGGGQNRWRDRGNLHHKPRLMTCLHTPLLSRRNEKNLKHLVAVFILDIMRKNQVFGQLCRITLQ